MLDAMQHLLHPPRSLATLRALPASFFGVEARSPERESSVWRPAIRSHIISTTKIDPTMTMPQAKVTWGGRAGFAEGSLTSSIAPRSRGPERIDGTIAGDGKMGP